MAMDVLILRFQRRNILTYAGFGVAGNREFAAATKEQANAPFWLVKKADSARHKYILWLSPSVTVCGRCYIALGDGCFS